VLVKQTGILIVGTLIATKKRGNSLHLPVAPVLARYSEGVLSERIGDMIKGV
jgi:hypothetical protein